MGPTGEFPTGARGLQTSRCWNRSPWKGRWPAPQLSPEGLSAGDGHVPALPTGTGSVEEVTLPALLWGGQREGSAMWGEEARPSVPRALQPRGSRGSCSTSTAKLAPRAGQGPRIPANGQRDLPPQTPAPQPRSPHLPSCLDCVLTPPVICGKRIFQGLSVPVLPSSESVLSFLFVPV